MMEHTYDSQEFLIEHFVVLFHGCCDSLLYKGSEDDDELGLEVTG